MTEKFKKPNIEPRTKFYMGGWSPLPTGRQARTMKIYLIILPLDGGGLRWGWTKCAPPHPQGEKERTGYFPYNIKFYAPDVYPFSRKKAPFTNWMTPSGMKMMTTTRSNP